MSSVMNHAVHFSSNTDDWATPQDLFNKLDKIFSFTLDPCASDKNAKCPKYYTVDDDGLSKTWDGERVFMNPPYGREIGEWVKKASESKALVVCLVPARTDTRWWHDYVINRGGLVTYVRGRLKFGDATTSAPFPSAIVIFAGGVTSSDINFIPA